MRDKRNWHGFDDYLSIKSINYEIITLYYRGHPGNRMGDRLFRLLSWWDYTCFARHCRNCNPTGFYPWRYHRIKELHQKTNGAGTF